MSIFKVVLSSVFVFFTVVAVLVFAGGGGGGGSQAGIGGEIIFWGSIPESQMLNIIDEINQNNNLYKISYVEKRKENFDIELVEALASGKGPDIFTLPNDLVVRHSDKVAIVAYTALTEREFKNTFIQEGEMYFTSEGILALPFSVDPLIMYWNRDLVSSAGLATPPATWSEFYELVPLITTLDKASNIIQNTVALGEFNNISHAKDILAILIMQAGNPIITSGMNGWQVVLSDAFGFSVSPAESALRFYTEFSNPAKPIYSWNKAEALSLNAFTSGKLAFYFGYASEFDIIKNKNPHLNFDIALLPQAKDSQSKITFGKMEGLAISKTSPNIATAFEAIKLLTSQKVSLKISDAIGLPSTRRDILSSKNPDPYKSIFNSAALMSRAWLDPSPRETDRIFQDMIEGVSSGRYRISETILRANSEIDRFFK